MATNRAGLKIYFQTNKRPTEAEFADLINSTVNWNDDKATSAQVQAGTDDTKFVTPVGAKAAILHFTPDAGETTKGMVELATVAEAEAGTNTTSAVTPAGAKKAAQTFSPIQTVNGQAPVAGNVTIPIVQDSGWIPISAFSNGTSSFDTSNTVRYRKLNGVVYLDGKIKGGLSQTNGTSYALFQLPLLFRPVRKTSFVVFKADTSSTFSIGRIDIDSATGTVYGVLYSNVFTNLSGIQFPI